MAIVLNKGGLQTKRNDLIDPKKDVVLTYSSPSAAAMRPAGTGGIPDILPPTRLPTAEELKGTFVLEPIQEPKAKLDRISNQLRDRIQKIRTQNLRNQGKFNLRTERDLALLTAGKVVIDNARGVQQLPSIVREVYKNPYVLKEVPRLIREEGARFGTLIKENPTEAITQVGAELVLLKGTSKALKLINRAGVRGITRLSPKYLGKLKTGKTYKVTLKIPKTTKRITLKIKKVTKGVATKKLKGSRVLKASIRKGRIAITAYKKGKRIQKINLRSVKRIPTMSLKRQIKMAGRSVSPVSAQAQRTLKILLKRKIKKPIPGEKALSKNLRKLIKKFDKGTITRKEISKLNKGLKKAKTKGLLERSFFADPYGRIRIKRLGLDQKDASLLDYLSGDITFKKTKPQVLVFKKQLLAKFPKSLRTVARKVAKGKRLTNKETTRLISWQLKKSKRFKPLGFITRESEISISPKSLLKRVRTAGVTYRNGKRIPIIQTEVVKPSKRLGKLLSKWNKGKITRKEGRALKRLYKKETKFKFNKRINGKASYYKKGGKYLSLRRAALSMSKRPFRYKRNKIKFVREYKTPRTTIKRVTYPFKPYRKRTPTGGGGGVGKSSTPFKGYGKITRRITPPFKTTPRNKPGKPRYLTGKIRKAGYKVSSVKVQTFNVYGKAGKRFIKLNRSPLSKNDALSRGTYAVDHTTSKTFKIVPAGKSKRIAVIRQKEARYFNRKNYKFRGVKINRGRKFTLKNKYIEKRRYGIDTRGEKRGLTLARLKKSKKW